ncbi:hypothetical protein [Arthrobacter oryzae]|uniref:hypothetical protein n=1 Tax=Arthrobacter oryzae TaxID=409290 RepID=UPI0030C99BF1
MTKEEIALWVQVSAVVVAVLASIVALVISALDRRNAQRIAADDRRMAVKQSKLMFELEALTRLSQNLRRGGHTDSQIRQDMGAEAAALIDAIGPERLSRNWENRVGLSRAELEKLVDDPSEPEFNRMAVEAHLALETVAEELHELIRRGEP